MEGPLFREHRRLEALPHPQPPRHISKPRASASHQEGTRIFATLRLNAHLRLHPKYKARETVLHTKCNAGLLVQR